MRGGYFKSEGVVETSRILYLMIIFEIPDSFATSMPSFLAFFELLHWINTRHQAIIKQRICLSEVDNVKSKSFIFGWVDDSEIKPLCITLSVEIILQKQIIFTLVYLNQSKYYLIDTVEVSWLKLWIKTAFDIRYLFHIERTVRCKIRQIMFFDTWGVDKCWSVVLFAANPVGSKA